MSSGIFGNVSNFSFPVFPVRIDPHPSIPNKFTKRPLTRRSHLDRKPGPEWTEAEWPAHANGIAFVPADRGWVCIDLDEGHDAVWADANLPPTRTHQTPSGNYHLFYDCPGEHFGNAKFGPCIDTRGSEGWVPLPGVSEGYSIHDPVEPAPLPPHVRARLVDASTPKERAAAPDGLVENDDDETLIAEARVIIASHGRLYGVGDDPRGDRAYALANLLADKRNGDSILSHEKIVELMQEAGYGEIADDILSRRKVGDRGIEQITFDPPEPEGDFAAKFDRVPGTETDRFTVEWWAYRDIPARQQLIGPIDVGARVMLSGSTSAGKTMLGIAAGIAVATGTPLFADGRWAVPAAKRVLGIDAEMSSRQLKERVANLLDGRTTDGRFVLLSRLTDFPDAPPLNRPGGWEWVMAMIDLYRPDLILLDNIQSLLAGDLLDLNDWRVIQKQMMGLTRRGITQIWFHHLNAAGVSYGGETREWQMDLGMKLTKVGKQGICADLSFSKIREDVTADHTPGRVMRTPHGWQFTTIDNVRLAMVEDVLIAAAAELSETELAKALDVKPAEFLSWRGIQRFMANAAVPRRFAMPSC